MTHRYAEYSPGNYSADGDSSSSDSLPMASQTQRDLLRERMVQQRHYEIDQESVASSINSTRLNGNAHIGFPSVPNRLPGGSLSGPLSAYDLDAYSSQRLLSTGAMLGARHNLLGALFESSQLQGINLHAGSMNLRTGPFGILDSVGPVGRRNFAKPTMPSTSLDGAEVPLTRTLASQSASSDLTSIINRQQIQLALARDRLLLSHHAINQSLVIPPNILGMNLDLPTGAFPYPAGVNQQRGEHMTPALSSSYLGSPSMLPASGITGAASAQPIHQRRNGPNEQGIAILISESFPVKLHCLLMDLQLYEGGVDIAAFVPDGAAFSFRDVDRFETEVMRKYFPRMNKFASFQRQLNLYDFQRISDGPSRGAYFHPSFHRDFPHLCREMRRTKIKGGGNNLG